jgi:thioredoxin reductase
VDRQGRRRGSRTTSASPPGISGAELAEQAAIQARKFGARITIPAEAVALECEEDHYLVRLADEREILARTVVVASGARYRRLPVGYRRLPVGRLVRHHCEVPTNLRVGATELDVGG